MHSQMIAAVLAVFFLFSGVSAQKAELSITINEQFFDSLLDAVYQNAEPPEIPIAENRTKFSRPNYNAAAFGFSENSKTLGAPICGDSIRLLREQNGMRTAVRFREGKIYAPIAFTGSYAPPFVGCVELSGYAETNIDLEFDRNRQMLIGRAKVLNVNLNGTGGLGGSVIAKMIQSSIDKKVNPLNIVDLDKVSFMIPIQNSTRLRMKATDIRPEIVGGALNIHITYEFLKA